MRPPPSAGDRSPRDAPTAEADVNSLQQIIYWIVMYLLMLMPILIVTGLIFLWPDFAPKRVMGMDGLVPVALLHYLTAVLIVSFMIAHVYLGTTGTKVSSLFKMMINGWREH
jgi:thiosulfate reductase cytochrome b subunit